MSRYGEHAVDEAHTGLCTGTPPCRVAAGDTISISAVPSSAPPARFVRWSGCSTAELSPAPLGPISSDMSCTANFVRRFSIELSASGPGRVGTSEVEPRASCSSIGSGASCMVDQAQTLRVVAVADPGASFVRWEGVGCAGRPKSTILSATRDLRCTAVFETLRHVEIVSYDTTLLTVTSTLASGDGYCAANDCRVSSGAVIQLYPIVRAPCWLDMFVECTGSPRTPLAPRDQLTVGPRESQRCVISALVCSLDDF